MQPTLEDVKVVLPDVLEQWYRELVEVTDAGRVFVVIGQGEVEPDGGFQVATRDIDTHELSRILGEDVTMRVTQYRSARRRPVLLVASDGARMVSVAETGTA
jgi:hypothetical protein